RLARDERQVPEEDRDADQALDEVLDPGLADRGRRRDRDEQRQQEEHADAGQEGHPQQERDRTAPELDALAARLEVGAPDEPLRPDDQGLVEDDQAAAQRRLREA